MSRTNRKGLSPDVIVLAVGLKVLVTLNIQTDADLVNGPRGAIVDIILPPEEPPVDREQRVVKLRRPPSYHLVKLGAKLVATESISVGGSRWSL